MSKITGHGCDVVDALATSKIALDLPQRVQPEPAPSVAAVASPAGANLPMQRGKAAGRSAGAKSHAAPESEVLILKPTLWGMSIDLKEAYLGSTEGGSK